MHWPRNVIILSWYVLELYMTVPEFHDNIVGVFGRISSILLCGALTRSSLLVCVLFCRERVHQNSEIMIVDRIYTAFRNRVYRFYDTTKYIPLVHTNCNSKASPLTTRA